MLIACSRRDLLLDSIHLGLFPSVVRFGRGPALHGIDSFNHLGGEWVSSAAPPSAAFACTPARCDEVSCNRVVLRLCIVAFQGLLDFVESIEQIFRNHALQLPNDTFLAVTSISYLPLAETLRSHTSVISFAMSSYKGRLA